MLRNQKVEFVDRFTGDIGAAPFVVLLEYRGASVSESAEFRRTLERSGLRFEIVKNTLAKRAISGTEKEPLGQLFAGMTGVILSGEDPVAAAKAVNEAIQPKGAIQVKGGYFDGIVLDAEGVKSVATLPSREELLVQLLRTLQAGPRQVLGILQAPARDLLYLLKNYESKLAEVEGTE
ncbi:MAG: 50S ribosomal protein L10 [Alphaproteobacteria bacterium]|nr:50S ribosomal protein L10 [Alphaproteobacteria bacterium]